MNPYITINFTSSEQTIFAFFRNMEWCVCHFLIDNSVEVIPRNWIINECQCKWPLTTKRSKLSDLIKKREIPQDNWKTMSVKILGQYDKYTKY